MRLSAAAAVAGAAVAAVLLPAVGDLIAPSHLANASSYHRRVRAVRVVSGSWSCWFGLLDAMLPLALPPLALPALLPCVLLGMMKVPSWGSGMGNGGLGVLAFLRSARLRDFLIRVCFALGSVPTGIRLAMRLLKSRTSSAGLPTGVRR